MIEKQVYRAHEGGDVFAECYREIAKDEYDMYRRKLEEQAFVLREEYCLGESIFCAYAKHQDAIFLNYYPAMQELLVVTEPESTWLHYADESGVERVKPLIRQIELVDYGLSYVIRLVDGRFIIFDGGFPYEEDADELMRTLKELSLDEKPRIAAWIMTHPHIDHYRCFIIFYEKYGERIEIEKFIYNFPDTDDTELELFPALLVQEENKNISKLYELVTKIGAPVYRAHTGQVYQVGDVIMEILSSTDNMLDEPVKNFNRVSLVIRMTIEGQIILWGGDADFKKTKLATKYGNYLKADILQVPHHGFNGGDEECYDLIAADTCLVPTFDRVWFATKYKFFDYSYNQYLIYKADVKDFLIGGNGNITIELPYTARENVKEKLFETINELRTEISE